MDEKTTKLIKERFDALPDSIKEVILSSHYEESLIEIGKQYNLNVEQLGIVERETTLTMMGLTPTKDFEGELARELSIDRTKVSQVVKDINEKIFLKIRELLKLMNTPAGEEPSVEENSPLESPKNVPVFSQRPPATSFEPEGSQNLNGPKEEIKVNAEILKSAGIEIIEQAPTTSTTFPATIAPPVTPPITPLATPPVSGSILEQKMVKPFQIPMVTTEHSLENISKTNAVSVSPTEQPVVEKKKITDMKTSVPQAPKAYTKGGDPYRVNPE
ncbi:MAG: hypothetical protein Q7K54_00105 [Candidatus Parcubacteria bacterium]|nr:hypothetical protein [Candidatus Parcubacteria bacterium]